MKKNVLFTLLGVIALGSCKKVVEVKDLDKEINLYFTPSSMEAFTTVSTTWDTTYSFSKLKDFDKRDYKHIDSITFNVALITQNTGDTAFVKLFNITDNVDIANSLIVAPTTTNPIKFVEYHTNNILANLPEKRIDLGILIKSSKAARQANGADAHLKLRRN